ncbi:MAG: hypothetical protein BWX79_02528 [Alphaproteobacteria bacterium ADurb.Bin100]|nr:MAG: hypothetical protein BWX79_02528 [Alphaproteobacteria bacterium ADurb.Bin100]
MLPTRAAEALEGVARHVVAARHRNLLDRVGHLLHRDLDEAFRHILRRTAGLGGQHGKLRLHHVPIESLVGAMAKHPGKVRRLDLADHHVGVGHGQRAAAPVAGRAGVGARALRAHAKTCAVELQDGAATGRHGVDAHHRGAHAHASHLRLELAFELAGKVRYVRGGAAHVKADHALHAGQFGGAGHADDAAGRAGQDRVLALKGVCVGQAPGGLHEKNLHARHLAGHLLHVPAQDGRQVGIDHRRVAPADELHHRAGLVAGADLGEAHLPGDARGRLFVRGEAVAVQEDDGHAAQAGVKCGLQLRAQMAFIERLHHVALRADAFLGLDHAAVQQFGQHDAPVEQARAVLVSDAQRVAKPARGDQQRGLALALQQRVGGDRRAHLHALDVLRRHRLAGQQSQQVADAGDCRVAVLLGVVAEQLVRHQPAVGAFAHHVGEGAAAIDPELPAVASDCGGIRKCRVSHKSIAHNDRKTLG